MGTHWLVLVVDQILAFSLCVFGVFVAGDELRVPTLRGRAVQPELLVLVPRQLRQSELHLPPPRE